MKHGLYKRIKKYPASIKTIRQSCIIILLSVGLAYVIPPSQAAKERMEMYDAIRIFHQINAIALQRDRILHKQEGQYNKVRDNLFHKAENAFITTQSIEEKIKHAKELNIMIQEQDRFYSDKGYASGEQGKSFHELENTFNQIE